MDFDPGGEMLKLVTPLHCTAGLIVPFHLAAAIFRLLLETRPGLEESEPVIPVLCSTLQYLQSTWLVSSYYMLSWAVVFRYIY